MVPPKSSPKPASKPAGKPASTGTAAPPQSLFKQMKGIARLNTHMAKAKAVIAVREFTGPDGDYTVKLARVNHYPKDGVFNIVFEYHILDEGDHLNEKVVKFFTFKDSDYGTVESVQDEFYCTLQLMGVDTSVSDDEIEKQLVSLRTTMTPITGRVTTNKKKYVNIAITGLASAAKEVAETEYVAEETEEQVEEMVEEVAEETTDEWEETEEPDEAPPEEEVVEEPANDKGQPEDWVGYEMRYKNKSYKVYAALNTTGKCTIEDLKSGKKYVVKFDDLEPVFE